MRHTRLALASTSYFARAPDVCQGYYGVYGLIRFIVPTYLNHCGRASCAFVERSSGHRTFPGRQSGKSVPRRPRITNPTRVRDAKTADFSVSCGVWWANACAWFSRTSEALFCSSIYTCFWKHLLTKTSNACRVSRPKPRQPPFVASLIWQAHKCFVAKRQTGLLLTGRQSAPQEINRDSG